MYNGKGEKTKCFGGIFHSKEHAEAFFQVNTDVKFDSLKILKKKIAAQGGIWRNQLELQISDFFSSFTRKFRAHKLALFQF